MAHHLSAHARVPPRSKLEKGFNEVVYTYSCREKSHIICICTNGLWAVRSSLSVVSAVMQHCMNTNRYNTQHTGYTPRVSLKRTAYHKLHATQCFLRSQKLHFQSTNKPHFMEQEVLLPCAQPPGTCPSP